MVSNIEGENCEKIEVTLTEDILKKTCYWIIFKYLIDPYHKQQNSSRADLIGGFIDRWLNRIPETLIFDQLLKENGMEKYHVINDTFLYKDNISKNAPDILGLNYEKDGEIKYIPFVKFNNGKWYKNEGIEAPFLEMKTFRENQNLVTIPINQFEENNYYAIVESHVDKLYLLSLFSEDFLSCNIYKELFGNEEKNKQFILRDDGDQLESPQKWLDENEDIDESIKNPNHYLEHKINDLGIYKLLGIYKGSTISKYSIIAGDDSKVDDDEDEDDNKKPYKPLYLSKIESVEKEKLECLDNTVNKYEFYTEIKCIPVFIDSKDAKITVINETSENEIYISVDGTAKINNEDYEGFCKLEFDYFIENATKYYKLINIDKNIKNPIIKEEKELPRTGIIYKHYGKEKIFASFNIDFCDDSTVSIIKNNKNSNNFKVHGTVKIDDKYFKDTIFRLNFKKKDGVYSIESKEECNYDDDNLEIFLPSCNYEYIKMFNIFDSINIVVPNNSKLFFVKKTKTFILVKVEGSVKISGHDVNEGISKLKFGTRDKKYKFLKEPIIPDGPKEKKSKKKTYSLSNGLNYPVRCAKKRYDILSIKNNNSIIIKGVPHDLNEENYQDFKNIPIYIDSNERPEFKIRNVPFNVNLIKGSSIEVIENGKTTSVYVNGEVEINNQCYETGEYKLIFDVFDRSSNKEEVIFSKYIIPNEESSEEELTEELKKIAEEFD